MDVLVSGATGRVGGPLADRLIDRGHRVRVLTRSPGSAAAVRLGHRGARIVPGDLDRPGAGPGGVREAAAGADAVFVLTTPHHGNGAGAEVRQAITLAESAAAAGAGYLVYCSAAGADAAAGVPMLDSKRRVEEHLRTLGVPHAVVAPVYFMENLAYPWNVAALRGGQWPIPLPATRPVQLVSAADLGRFAALVIERPGEFAGRRVEVAGDEVTGPQAACVMSHALGHPIHHAETVPPSLAPMAPFFRWLAGAGFHANVEGLRRGYPEAGWRSLREWVAAQDWTGWPRP